MAQHQFWTIIAWLAYTNAYTVCMYIQKLVVNWQPGLEVVLVVFLGEIMEQTKPIYHRRQTILAWEAGSVWVQAGMNI